MNNLAVTYKELGNMARAEYWFKQALMMEAELNEEVLEPLSSSLVYTSDIHELISSSSLHFAVDKKSDDNHDDDAQIHRYCGKKMKKKTKRRYKDVTDSNSNSNSDQEVVVEEGEEDGVTRFLGNNGAAYNLANLYRDNNDLEKAVSVLLNYTNIVDIHCGGSLLVALSLLDLNSELFSLQDGSFSSDGFDSHMGSRVVTEVAAGVAIFDAFEKLAIEQGFIDWGCHVLKQEERDMINHLLFREVFRLNLCHLEEVNSISVFLSHMNQSPDPLHSLSILKQIARRVSPPTTTTTTTTASNSNKIHIITQWFEVTENLSDVNVSSDSNDKNSMTFQRIYRQWELDTCLRGNLENELVDKVHVLVENEKDKALLMELKERAISSMDFSKKCDESDLKTSYFSTNHHPYDRKKPMQFLDDGCSKQSRFWLKLKVVNINSRATFQDLLQYSHKLLLRQEIYPDTVVAILNADIWLHEPNKMEDMNYITTKYFKVSQRSSEKQDGVTPYALALTRWEWWPHERSAKLLHSHPFSSHDDASQALKEDEFITNNCSPWSPLCLYGGEMRYIPRADSQDGWLFQASDVTLLTMNKKLNQLLKFKIGTPRCDNRLAQLLHEAGFTVINPSLHMKLLHFHHKLVDQDLMGYSGFNQVGGRGRYVPIYADR
jgi:hypothetical protein